MLNFAGRQNNLTKRDNVKQINWGGGGGVGGFNVSENRKLCDIIPLTGFTCKP